MKKQILILSVLVIFLFPNCKNIIGPSLPDEIQGTWRDTYSSYYYLEYTFTKDHVNYHDYASNTGGSTDWDCELDEIIDDGTFTACADYYYYHVSGNTLYLIRDNETRNLSDEWWNDEDVVKNTLTKQ